MYISSLLPPVTFNFTSSCVKYVFNIRASRILFQCSSEVPSKSSCISYKHTFGLARSKLLNGNEHLHSGNLPLPNRMTYTWVCVNMTLFISKTMLRGTDNIQRNIPPVMLNIGNIMWNIGSPTKHCYTFEWCYEPCSNRYLQYLRSVPCNLRRMCGLDEMNID